MATAANQKVPQSSGSDLAGIAQLVSLLGGQRGTTTTTTNPGDTAALQAALSQLQSADYTAMLEGIFRQAGAQIPGLRNAYTSSIGARGRSNSAIESAMAQLLKATTLQAQEKIAAQQLANQQTQVQAGNAIANATKGTQTTQATKSGLDLGRAAALLALWQGIGQLTGGKKLTDMFPSMTGGAAGAGVTSTAPAIAAPVGTVMASPPQTVEPMSAAPVTSNGGIGDMLSNLVRAMGNVVAYGSTTPPTLTPTSPTDVREIPTLPLNDVTGIKSFNNTPDSGTSMSLTDPDSLSMSVSSAFSRPAGPYGNVLLGIPQPAQSIPGISSYWDRPSFDIAYGD